MGNVCSQGERQHDVTAIVLREDLRDLVGDGIRHAGDEAAKTENEGGNVEWLHAIASMSTLPIPAEFKRGKLAARPAADCHACDTQSDKRTKKRAHVGQDMHRHVELGQRSHHCARCAGDGSGHDGMQRIFFEKAHARGRVSITTICDH
jgi:hypothetical protein